LPRSGRRFGFPAAPAVMDGALLYPGVGVKVRVAEYVAGALPASPYAARNRSSLIDGRRSRMNELWLATQLTLNFG